MYSSHLFVLRLVVFGGARDDYKAANDNDHEVHNDGK